MKLKDLMYFDKLAELKNYTEVSEYFNVKQPTITFAIQRLENEFNVELINRSKSHHDISLTPEAEELEKHVKKIAEQVNQIDEEMKVENNQPIRFGLPPIIGNYYFPALASKLISAGILNHLDNSEGGSKELLNKLKEGKIDLALLGSSKPLNNNELSSQLLTSDQYEFVVNPTSPLSKKKSLSFNDIATQDFVGLTDAFVHAQVFKEMCDLHSIEPNIKYQTSDIDLIKQLVSENVGMAFLVKKAIKPSDNLITIPINSDDLPPFDISISHRKSHVLSPKENDLINILSKSISTKK